MTLWDQNNHDRLFDGLVYALKPKPDEEALQALAGRRWCDQHGWWNSDKHASCPQCAGKPPERGPRMNRFKWRGWLK